MHMPALITAKLCTAPGCERLMKAKGYCLMHYRRVQKHGDVNITRDQVLARGFADRKRPSKRVEMSCAECGSEFSALPSELASKNGRNVRKYCSAKCSRVVQMRVPTFVCQTCGNESDCRKMSADGGYYKRAKYCSRACQTSAKSTGFVDKSGYVNITVDGNQVFEHRHVMERSIGRALFAHETVHHKNGIRADNRIENLELWSSRHGAGQRVEDKIAFAKSLLTEYGVEFTNFNISGAAAGLLSMAA